MQGHSGQQGLQGQQGQQGGGALLVVCCAHCHLRMHMPAHPCGYVLPDRSIRPRGRSAFCDIALHVGFFTNAGGGLNLSDGFQFSDLKALASGQGGA